MILFHGTTEDNIKNIKKMGILEYTSDQWLTETFHRQVCCVSNQPISGEGGNASYFAYGFAQAKNQAGYLVVLDVPREILLQKSIAIFDNKSLDDYVRFHFFPREEFRNIGYPLFHILDDYKQTYHNLTHFDTCVSSRRPALDDEIACYIKDQRSYYKKKREDCYIYTVGDIPIRDETSDMLQYIGNWDRVYDFLCLHFAQQNMNNSAWKVWEMENAHVSNVEYWQNFYRQYTTIPKKARDSHFTQWFSPEWLRKIALPIASLQTSQATSTQNCQILCKHLEPQYIIGFIQITTPSGFVEKFRNARSKSTFISEVWKEVYRISKRHT